MFSPKHIQAQVLDWASVWTYWIHVKNINFIRKWGKESKSSFYEANKMKPAWRHQKRCPCLRSTQNALTGKILSSCFSNGFPQSCWYLPTEAQLSSVLVDATLVFTARKNKTSWNSNTENLVSQIIATCLSWQQHCWILRNPSLLAISPFLLVDRDADPLCAWIQNT